MIQITVKRYQEILIIVKYQNQKHLKHPERRNLQNQAFQKAKTEANR